MPPGWQDGAVLDDAPAPPPPAPVAAPSDAPKLDMSRARNVTPTKGGAYEDAQGNACLSAPDLGAGFFRDASGAQFHDTGLAPKASPAAHIAPTGPPNNGPQAWDAAPALDGEQMNSGATQTWDSAPVLEGGDAAPIPVPPRGPGMGAEVGAGAVKGLTGLPDALGILFNAGPDSTTAQMLRQMLTSDPRVIARAKELGLDPATAIDLEIRKQTGVGYWIDKGIGAVTGWNPEDVPATTPTERIEQAVGGGLSTALIPGGEETTLANLGRNAIVGATAAGGSQAATEAAPDAIKPYVGLPAGVLAAVATHGALKLPQIAGDAAAPMLANVSRSAAESQAGARIAKAASDLPAVKATLGVPPTELVPGSEPTLPQITQDPGLIGLQRKTAARTPEGAVSPFAQREADQNAARAASLHAIEPGGDPAAVSRFFTDRLDAIDAQATARVEAARNAAQTKTSAIGGEGTPETYGAGIRDTVVSADQARSQAVRDLYSVVDPTGNATANVVASKTAASGILGEMQPTSAPMSAEEATAFKAASEMPDVAPLKMLTELRSNVGAQLRNAEGPARARLSQLYGAIQQNLSTSIAQRVQSERAQVAAGTLAPEATIEANVRNWIGDFLQGRTQARAASAGSGAPGSGGSVGVGSAGAPGVSGAASASGEPPVGASGNPGLPSASGQPTIDAATVDRLNTAAAASKDYHATFDAPPVADATATAGSGSLYRTPDGALPSKYFHPGPKAYDDTTALLKASPNAAPVLADYAALSLRRAAMTPDGVIDPGEFAKWQARHQDALRALPPDVQARFADAASAGQAVADAGLARKQAIAEAQLGAVGRVLRVGDPADVSPTIGRILAGPTSSADLTTLAQQTKSNPAAFQGLRRAVADNLASAMVKSDGTLDTGSRGGFVARNRAALGKVFNNPGEMDALDNIVADGQRSSAAAGVKVGKAGLPQKVGEAVSHSGLAIVSSMLGESLGAALGHGSPMGEVVGGALGAGGGLMIQALRANGVAKIDDLVREALLNPQLASKLLARVPANRPGVRQAMLRGVIGALATGNGAPITLRAGPPQIPQRPPNAQSPSGPSARLPQVLP